MISYRNELKYICSETDLTIIENRIRTLCQLDSHVGIDGIYHIRSIYFDNLNNQYYYDNENGTEPREKFRIRSYNADATKLFFECKRKEHTKTFKESCLLEKEQCDSIIDGTYKYTGYEDKVLLKFLSKYYYCRRLGNV